MEKPARAQTKKKKNLSPNKKAAEDPRTTTTQNIDKLKGTIYIYIFQSLFSRNKKEKQEKYPES